MLDRCYNPEAEAYPNYGGRGIRVCAEWCVSFEQFYRDMGSRPTPKHSLDRRDNDGWYTPDNCRWATQTEQTRNTRKNRRFLYRGRPMTIQEIVEVSGTKLLPSALYHRLVLRGWDVEFALTQPLRAGHRPPEVGPRKQRVSSVFYPFRGSEVSIHEAMAATGSTLGYYTILQRLRRGWSLERAVTEPVRI
jgi:hypothetical protein